MSTTRATVRRWLVARQRPGATLIEAALLCALLLAGLALAGASLSPIMLQRGNLNAVPIAVLWGALRLETPRGSRRRRLAIEGAMALAVPATVWGLLLLSALMQATYGEPAAVASTDVYLAVIVVSAGVLMVQETVQRAHGQTNLMAERIWRLRRGEGPW